MNVAQGEKFSCPQCGKQYPWKQQYAGRKVSCACGSVFTAPASMEQEEGETYDILEDAAAEAPAPMASSSKARRAAVLPSHDEGEEEEARPARRASAAIATGGAEITPYGTIRTRRRVEEDEDNEEEEGGPIRNLHAPGLMLALAVGLLISEITWKKTGARLELSPIQMIIAMGVGVLSMLGGVILAARILSLNLGSMQRMVFKIAAITLLGAALAIPLVRFDKDPDSITGPAIAWNIMILTYWIGVGGLFKQLELHETLLTVFIATVLQSLVFWLVLAPVGWKGG